jgi:hypothetical protein
LRVAAEAGIAAKRLIERNALRQGWLVLKQKAQK